MERKKLPPELRDPEVAVAGFVPPEGKSDKSNFRITHPDQHNWILEQFRKGGNEITRGKFSGKIQKDKWVTIGHYPNLRRAVLGWLQEEVYLALPNGQGDAQAILSALDKAEARLVALLPSSIPEKPAED